MREFLGHWLHIFVIFLAVVAVLAGFVGALYVSVLLATIYGWLVTGAILILVVSLILALLTWMTT